MNHMCTPPQAAYADRLAEFLAESGLAPDDVPTWRYLESGAHVREALVTDRTFDGPGIWIPYFDSNGEPIVSRGVGYGRARLLDTHDQATGKYQSTPASRPHLYIPRNFRKAHEKFRQRTGKSALFIVEGEKKAEAGIKAGLPVVGIAGVWMWAEPRTSEDRRLRKPKFVLPELNDLIQEYDPAGIVIIFDADGRVQSNEFFRNARIENHKKIAPRQYVLNKDVNTAARDCADTIAAQLGRGAQPFFVPFGDVPEPEKGAPKIRKRGLDDWLLDEQRDGDRCPAPIFRDIMAALSEAEEVDEAAISALHSARQQKLDDLERAQDGGYIALGYAGDEDVIVWNRARESIVGKPSSKITNVATIMAMAGPEYTLTREDWQTSDADDGKRGIDVIQAAADIVRDCTAAGPFSADSAIRGAGVWRDNDDPDVLIVNGANGVFRIEPGQEPEEIPRCEAGRKNIYPRRAVAPRVLPSDEIMEYWPIRDDYEKDLIKALNCWTYKNNIDGALLAGWWCSSAYLGALEARPGIFVTGESGAGKTSLFDRLSRMMGNYVQHIEMASDSSTPGIRQMLKKDALPLILDELEPGNSASSAGKKRAEVVESLFRMLRASYSSGGENRHGVVKGSAGGEAVDFSIVTAGLVGGVNVAQLEQADRNRMLVVELTRPNRDAPPEMPEDPEHLGDVIRNMMWRYWPHWRRNYPRIVKIVKDHLGKADSRVPATYATAICSAAIYIVANRMLTEADEIDTMVCTFAERIAPHVHEHFTRGGDGGGTDQENLWARLLSFRLRVQHSVMRDGAVTRSVEEQMICNIAECALQEHDGGPHNQALRDHGLLAKRDKNGVAHLWISQKSHTGRAQIEKVLGMPSLAKSLSRLPEALSREQARDGALDGGDGRVRLGKGWQGTGVWVRLAADDADD